MILKPQRQSCHRCCLSNRHTTRFADITISPAPIVRRSSILLHDSSAPVDVIGTSDVIYGTLIALVLAFTASFLQGRRNNSDFVLSEVSDRNTTKPIQIDDDVSSSSEGNTFDADSWKEISQPESYVFYKQKLRERELKSSSESSFGSERKWVLFALLALFVPIFSIEFFFALSRQLICGGDFMNQSDLSELLCSPAMMN